MQHKEEYDITAAFRKIEDELIASMIRNLDRHRAEEDELEINWSQWQVEQLRALELYKVRNQKKYKKQFQLLNKRIEGLIKIAHDTGNMEQEIEIMEAIKNGFKGYKRASGVMQAEFFHMNEKKLNALIQATVKDMQKAETAILRMANDKYRKVIFNAQVFANTGAGTYEKAVDMATREMLAAGLNCVEYANGARHTLSDYADMAIRTASKRAYLQGEGQKRQEWGITTVIMNKRGNPCPKCLPFCGKVLIDDVWSGGSKEDGKYPLMSYAISKGLYHPRCKDGHTTYFEGISTADDTWTKEELEAVSIKSKQEAKLQYAERQEKKFGRLARYSLDNENRNQYRFKEHLWRNVRFRTGDMSGKEYAANKGTHSNNVMMDVTHDWVKHAIPKSHEIVDLQEYCIEGVTYVVDGKYVIMDYKKTEKRIGELLRDTFGGEICMVPRVLSPKGISTPDYIFRGERFDLKELFGESKNLIYNAIAKKKKQANNFILEISNCPLSTDEIYRQVAMIYQSRHTGFVDKLIIVKDNKILKVFERKKK